MALVFRCVFVHLRVVCFVVGGTVQLGYAKFNLALSSTTREAQVSDLFSQFHRFETAFCCRC